MEVKTSPPFQDSFRVNLSSKIHTVEILSKYQFEFIKLCSAIKEINIAHSKYTKL